MRRLPGRLVLAAAILAHSGCGGGGPAGPNPEATPAPITTPGGVISGRYVLKIELARECAGAASVLSFAMDGRQVNAGLRLGVQVALQYNPVLEMELEYDSPNLVGNIGTSGDSVSALEVRDRPLWIYGIVSGAVSSENGGPGQVLQGTFIGDVAFDRPDAPCFSAGHRWSLRVQ
jgi:hypothetical protein